MDFRKNFVVKKGRTIKLSKINPNYDDKFKKDIDFEAETIKNTQKMAELQYKLYAEGSQSLLIVLQALDAAGKDGVVNHVMTALNPQGCRVCGFKKPSSEELAHDFLWRVHRQVPKQGEMVVFNRSHYEDVLVSRVHDLVPKRVWKSRYDHINNFEDLLTQNNTKVIKFFLHISKEEQLKRFIKRLDDPTKHWKISESDYSEREYWDDYTSAFEDVFSHCSTESAPWYIIPSNSKKFRNMAVSQIIVKTMEDMKMQMPPSHVNIAEIRKKAEKLERDTLKK